MKQLTAAMFGLALMAAACGGSDDPSAAPSTTDSSAPPSTTSSTVAVEGTIGPAGGVVASDTGGLRIEIPAGALAEEVPIEIVEVAAADAGLEGLPVLGAVYDLRPNGTEFAVPATLVRSLDVAEMDLGDDVVPFLLVMQIHDDSADALASATTRSGDTIEVTTEVSRFSANVVIDTAEAFGAEIVMTLDPATFSTVVRGKWEVTASRGSEELIGIGSFDWSATGALSIADRPDSDTGSIFAGEAVATCESAGNGTYTAATEEFYEVMLSNDITVLLEELKGITEDDVTTKASMSATGIGTCHEPPPVMLVPVTVDGTLTLVPVGTGTGFEDLFRLELTPADPPGGPPADSPFPGAPWELITRALADADVAGAGEYAFNAKLTQVRPDGSEQTTVGGAVDRGDGTIRAFTGWSGQWMEVYVIDVVPCPGFPESCNQVDVEGINVGGSPDLDMGQAFLDATGHLGGNGELDQYGWAFVIEPATMTETG